MSDVQRNLSSLNRGEDFKFRLATPNDQASLLRLVRQTPMEGSMRLYYDRGPDFFNLLRLQGQSFKTIVAVNNSGEIIACISFTFQKQIWNGEKTLVGRTSDLRVAPGYRGRKLAKLIVGFYSDEVIHSDTKHIGCEILHGNKASVASLYTIKDRVDVRLSTEAKIYQLLPLRKYRPSKKYNFRSATTDDRDNLIELLQSLNNKYDGAPVFDHNFLANLDNDGIPIASFKLAEHNGKVVAAIADWNQHPIRKLVVERYDFSAKLLVLFGRLIYRWLRIPKPPLSGETLPYTYLRFPACRDGYEEALSQLIRLKLNEIFSSRKFLFAIISFSDKDTIGHRLLKRIPRISSKAEVYIASKKKKESQCNIEKVPYVDFSIC